MRKKVETKKKKMRVAGVECPVCLEKIWSRHRHDYRHCKCGYSSIDGGRDYVKVGYGLKFDISYDRTMEIYKHIDLFNKAVGAPRSITLLVERPEGEQREPRFPY